MEKITSYAGRRENISRCALSASEAGTDILNDMQKKLRFADSELQRMENEGGIPMNDEQTAKADAYFKAGRRIRKVLLIARQVLPPKLANLPIFETH